MNLQLGQFVQVRSRKHLVERIEAQQQKAIKAIKAIKNSKQTTMDFSGQELRQFNAEQKHWQARLNALPGEFISEPLRIQTNYEVQASRVEPVGLIDLWPISG
jgi:hypothetical protein